MRPVMLRSWGGAAEGGPGLVEDSQLRYHVTGASCKFPPSAEACGEAPGACGKAEVSSTALGSCW